MENFWGVHQFSWLIDYPQSHKKNFNPWKFPTLQCHCVRYLIVGVSRDRCRLSSAGPRSRRNVSRSSITLACWQGIIATDTHSQRLRRLIGKEKLAIGASTTHNSTTLPTVMLGREEGKERERDMKYHLQETYRIWLQMVHVYTCQHMQWYW